MNNRTAFTKAPNVWKQIEWPDDHCGDELIFLCWEEEREAPVSSEVAFSVVLSNFDEWWPEVAGDIIPGAAVD